MVRRQLSPQRPCIHPLYSLERGAALVTALVLLVVLALLGMAAVLTGILDTKISGNYKTSVQAFYAAEAGLAETRARLRYSAGDLRIAPSTTPQWKAYMTSGARPPAAALQRARDLGYNTVHHTHYASGQAALDYTVIIEPAAAGVDQLRLTSHGSVSGAEKSLQIVLLPPPSFVVPAALYVATHTVIRGGTTEISGRDGCGSEPTAGLLTPLSSTAVESVQAPTIDGAPVLVDNGTPVDVSALVHTLKPYANFTYTVSNATHTPTTTPGPGDNWGYPISGLPPQPAGACHVYNVVYYQTVDTSIQLRNGVSGCGILLVDGDLELQQGFSWYGLVLVTGRVTVVPSLLHQHRITGALLAGGSSGQNDLGADTHIGYCSAAVHPHNLPWRVLSWKELYSTPP